MLIRLAWRWGVQSGSEGRVSEFFSWAFLTMEWSKGPWNISGKRVRIEICIDTGIVVESYKVCKVIKFA